MQISNLSQLASAYTGISNTVARRSLTDQLPDKAVTIEGQIFNDNEENKHARKLERENLSADQTKQESNENQQQLANIATTTITEESGSTLLQSALPGDAFSNRLSPEQIENKAEHSFPYSNRRSANGLAGSALVIQKYLNNEPDKTAYSENPLFNNFI